MHNRDTDANVLVLLITQSLFSRDLEDFSQRARGLLLPEEHGVFIDSDVDDTVGSFGVVFHERYHSLYNSQAEKVKIKMDNYFLKSSSYFKIQARDWMDEVLATSLGNGWAYTLATNGVIDSGSWCNNNVINKFSKPLFPLTKKNAELSQPIDQNFIIEAINIYAANFPDSIYSFDSLFTNVMVLH